ncbi:MAG: dihydrodipicolinate synthase family protein [Chloroflexota bacterium]
MVKSLHGVLPVLVTPMTADERVDVEAYRRLVQRVLDAGAHGVVVLGSAGEFAALEDDEKDRAINTAVEQVAGRVPVIVGTGEPGTSRAVARTQRATALGADAALVVPPYYYRVSDDAVVRHYQAVAREGGLPILLYNTPVFTKVELSLDVLRALSGEPGVAGMKDSSANLRYYQTVAEGVRSERFTLLTGSDGFFFQQLVIGCDGCISPGANVATPWFVELWEAMQAGRWQEAWVVQQRIAALHRGMGQGAFPAGIKGALSLLGIGGTAVAAPNVPVTDAQLQTIAATLREFGLL